MFLNILYVLYIYDIYNIIIYVSILIATCWQQTAMFGAPGYGNQDKDVLNMR